MSLKIDYPELPVVEHREEFFEMLEKHQVVIVKADTGSVSRRSSRNFFWSGMLKK